MSDSVKVEFNEQHGFSTPSGNALTDPGNNGTIDARKVADATVTLGANTTYTIADPAYVGQSLSIVASAAAASRACNPATNGVQTDGSTALDLLTLTANQWANLVCVRGAAGALVWKAVATNGTEA